MSTANTPNTACTRAHEAKSGIARHATRNGSRMA
jgi:hypothetical protein